MSYQTDFPGLSKSWNFQEQIQDFLGGVGTLYIALNFYANWLILVYKANILLQLAEPEEQWDELDTEEACWLMEEDTRPLDLQDMDATQEHHTW